MVSRPKTPKSPGGDRNRGRLTIATATSGEDERTRSLASFRRRNQRALLHEHADDVDRPLAHAVGEFLDGDRLGDDHLARQLLLLLHLTVAGEALVAAAERGERTSACS
jgi:hypothetical protein